MTENGYLFIIWENARKKEKQILKKIQEKFSIRIVYEIKWSQDKFPINLKRFYGANLPKPLRKTLECGTGEFLLVIVTDPNEKIGKRKTSSGTQLVNTNIYDSKMEIRNMFGGGYPIHSSIHEKETNHDLALLLGKNLISILENCSKKWNNEIKKLEMDLVGTKGWKDFKQFFSVLNETSNYVILRNFEQLPDKFMSKKHQDIDILTDDMLQTPYLLNQRKSKEKEGRVPPTVKIGNDDVLFDIRYVGDRYYDQKWSKDILKRRILSNNGFYTPSLEDYFYSLLYHAIIHKSKLSDEYMKKISSMANELKIREIQEEGDLNSIKLKKILDNYMKKMGYTYTDSLQYKIKHNEFTRLSKVMRYALKNEGVHFLLRAIKGKIHRKILQNLGK